MRSVKELETPLMRENPKKEDKDVESSPPKPIMKQADPSKAQLVSLKDPLPVKVPFPERL